MINIYKHFAFLIPLAICLQSCVEKNITQSTTIIHDLTEEYFNDILVSDIKKISALSSNANNGEIFRIAPITELGFNTSFELSIQKVSNVLISNDFYRSEDITVYFTQIDSVLMVFNHLRKTRSGSAIFKILAEELNRLSDVDSDRKVLVAHADCMEKSFIDFYDKKIIKTIRNKPDSIQMILLQSYPIKRLDGIEIFLVYQPRDKNESERFELVAGFYTKLFESYGAKVHIVGSI